MSSPGSVADQVREKTRVILGEITATLHNSPPAQLFRRKSGNESFTKSTSAIAENLFTRTESSDIADAHIEDIQSIDIKLAKPVVIPDASINLTPTRDKYVELPAEDIQLTKVTIGDDLDEDISLSNEKNSTVHVPCEKIENEELIVENLDRSITLQDLSVKLPAIVQETLDLHTKDTHFIGSDIENKQLGITDLYDSIPSQAVSSLSILQETFKTPHTEDDYVDEIDVITKKLSEISWSDGKTSEQCSIEYSDTTTTSQKCSSSASTTTKENFDLDIKEIHLTSLTGFENNQFKAEDLDKSIPFQAGFISLPRTTEENFKTQPGAIPFADIHVKGNVSEADVSDVKIEDEIFTDEYLDDTLRLQDISESSSNTIQENLYLSAEDTQLTNEKVEVPSVEEIFDRHIEVTYSTDDNVEEKISETHISPDYFINLSSTIDKNQEISFKQEHNITLSLTADKEDRQKLKSITEYAITDDIKSSLKSIDDNDHIASTTSETFWDPRNFDFLLSKSNSINSNRLRADSLYVRFDPLLSNTSMLPQGSNQSIAEEQNGKSESQVTNVGGTPQRNAAIAAIDRLLFYSPMSLAVEQKSETQQKNEEEEPVQESKSDIMPVSEIDLYKELELVRSTVLQLQEELDKQMKDSDKQRMEVEKQKEKNNKLQLQLAQEVKNKNQMTVVVEEYEKSISRLVADNERDRTNLEQEKSKLQEELQAAHHHLTNTEAAFNDVHQKYERLKGVVSAYKNNETVLKESIQENEETIKCLQNRYDQLKNHAMSQLEKANLELDVIRKQNEAETVKLHAMVRKAELKSNSLAELVEQKTKENKELTQILDEVIARVGHQNAE